ncbi:MAG: sodium:solute symporter family protein [Deltaproteobacteria bacterium]|jgi:Na+/proline symporter|nr:sodium:solute symporter family protein [Deltaproteobacteria bacterium]
MSAAGWGVSGLVVYLLILVVVAEVAKRARRDASPSDHFLAGRSLGTFVLFLTLYATAYSGNSLLGYPGRAYRSGFSFIMATGFMMSIIVVFHALVPRLRPLAVRHAFVTPGDWLRQRFDGPWERPLRIAVALLMSVALANFLLAQLKAMGDIASLVTDGAVPYALGVVGLAGVILFYETRGGMRAVAWTDAAQGIAMLVGLAALLAWLLVEAGGLDRVTRAVADVRPEAVALPEGVVCANWFSTIVLMGFASVLYPQAIQRIFAAESAQALRRSFMGMTFMPLVTTLVVTLIGIAAITRFDLATAVESDGVVPLLLREWTEAGGLSTAASMLVLLGALSAIMSTADSCLLSLGSLLSRDLLGEAGRDAAATRLGKRLAAAMLLATIPLALQRDVTLWRLIELKMELLIQCVPAFLVALHWRGLRAGPTLLGLAVGTGVAAGCTLFGMPRIGGVHVGVLACLLNLAIALVGSLAGGPRPAIEVESEAARRRSASSQVTS